MNENFEQRERQVLARVDEVHSGRIPAAADESRAITCPGGREPFPLLDPPGDHGMP
jgi:hypothetical protein